MLEQHHPVNQTVAPSVTSSFSLNTGREGRRLHHGPGRSIPTFHHPLSQEFLLAVLSEHFPLQLETMSFYPVTVLGLQEEADLHLVTPFFQAVVESNKFAPEPLSSRLNTPLFPQLLLMRLVLQTLHQFCAPFLEQKWSYSVPISA